MLLAGALCLAGIAERETRKEAQREWDVQHVPPPPLWADTLKRQGWHRLPADTPAERRLRRSLPRVPGVGAPAIWLSTSREVAALALSTAPGEAAIWLEPGSPLLRPDPSVASGKARRSKRATRKTEPEPAGTVGVEQRPSVPQWEEHPVHWDTFARLWQLIQSEHRPSADGRPRPKRAQADRAELLY